MTTILSNPMAHSNDHIAHFNEIAPRYDEAAFLTNEMAVRLLEHTEGLEINPLIVVDLGSGTGFLGGLLQEKYPEAQIINLEGSFEMLKISDRKKYEISTLKSHEISDRKNQEIYDQKRNHEIFDQENHNIPKKNQLPYSVCGRMENIPFKQNSIDFILANCSLPWILQPMVFFESVKKLAKTNGVFLFSTLGPDTLKECKRELDPERPKKSTETPLFIDMHDLGDMLLKAGFSKPVMMTEMITIRYSNFDRFRNDLRYLGLKNLIASHYQIDYEGIQTPISVTFEIIYGYAKA